MDVELEYHPYVLTHLEPVLALHDKYGIVTEAYGPLTPILRHPGGPLKPVLEKISQRLGVDAGTVLLLWTMQKGAVAVTTSTKPDNIKKLATLNTMEGLSQEDMEEIEKVGKSVHFRHYKVRRDPEIQSPGQPRPLAPHLS